MNVPRASATLLIALAAGTGGRLLFESPAPEPKRPAASHSSKNTEAGAASPSPAIPSLPSPSAADVLGASGPARLKLLVAWLAAAGNEDLLQMAGRLVPMGSDDGLALRLLMLRWAEVNPQGMMAWAEKIEEKTPGIAEEGWAEYGLTAWGRADFSAAWTAASSHYPAWRASVLQGLAESDPARCCEFLTNNPAAMELVSRGAAGSHEMIARIAGWNPSAAVGLLENVPLERRGGFAGSIASVWVRDDPAATIAWIKTLPASVQDSLSDTVAWIAGHAPELIPALLEGQLPGSFRSAILTADLRELAARDPAAAQRQLEELPDGPTRQYGRAILMQGALKAGDLAVARAMADQIGWHFDPAWDPNVMKVVSKGEMSWRYFGYNSESAEAGLGDLMSRIAAADPASAADILLVKGRPEQLAGSAAAADPGAMAAALAAHAEEPEAVRACALVVDSWAGKDPAAVAAWLDTLESGSALKQSSMASLCQAWAVSDPAALWNWASSKDGTMESAWSSLVSGAPGFVLGHLDQLFAANDPHNIQTLLERLAEQPADAQAVLRRMPDNLQVEIRGAVTTWLEADREGAGDWISGLAQGPKRNEAVAALAWWLNDQRQEPETAFKWAVTMPEDGRGELLDHIVESLGEANPAKAAALIRSSSLTPEEKKSFLEEIPPPP